MKKGVNLRDLKPIGGESWDEVLDRARLFLDELIIENVKKDFNSSSHKLIKRTQSTVLDNNSSSKNFQRSSSQQFSRQNTISIRNSVTQNFQSMELNKIRNSVIGELNYFNTDYSELFKNEDFIRKMSKIYKGFQNELGFKRVLLVSHSGFIMEFLNSIRLRRNIKPKFVNDSKSSSLYIFKIYCSNCGSVCYSKDQNCKLQFDMVIYNNIDHLKLM